MLVLLTFLHITFSEVVSKYEPNWNSLDSRPLPIWYDDVKFGIFCHWGVYSVPAFRSEWIWWYWQGDKPNKDVVNYIRKNYKPGTTYADFAKDFTAELFDPREFADIVNSSGAKYFVLTSKHHEGFTMWPSRTSWNWNAKDIGPKRDIVGEIKESFKSFEIHFGLYFSQLEWFHPMFLHDSKFNTTMYVDQVSYPQLIEITSRYKPEIVWSDGDWGKSDDYWKSKQYLTWLYNKSPVKDFVVVNDRWGRDSMGKHGGFFTYADHYDPGKLLHHKWENCMTMDKDSWGHRREMKSTDVHSVHELIEQLVRTVSCGGNLLLNIGPDMHGKIPAIFEDRLRELGRFIFANSEALYGTKPWIFQNDTGNIWYTSKMRTPHLQKGRLYNPQLKEETIIYAWIIDVPEDDFELSHIEATDSTKITFLGTDVSYIHAEYDILKIPFKKIPWRKLQRTDVFVLKIESAASKLHNPLKKMDSGKTHAYQKFYDDTRWAYELF